MKYQNWKIKVQHHFLKEFKNFLKEVEKIPEVKRIIPGRIKRQQKWTSDLKVSFSYYTNSWLKFLMKKWSTVQEVFIVCDKENRAILKDKILEILL